METVTAVSLLRHLGRGPFCWGKRTVVCPDNMCSIGVLGKGRPSTRRLLGLARSAAVVTLGCGIRILMSWVPSRLNWADGPSRGHAIGYFDHQTRQVTTSTA